MLRLGLVYKFWPLSVMPDRLSRTARDLIIMRTEELFAREQERRREEGDSDG